MATRTRPSGMSGLALAMAAVGGYAVYAGLNNIPFASGLRDLVGGKLPAGTAPKQTTVAWSGSGSAFAAVSAAVAGAGPNARIADAARKYLGVPYVFGGHTPAGFDCSGLVTYVLVHDLGMTNLPSNTHTVTGQFLVWSGAQTIPKEQCQAGDLVCWPGHMGIATGQKTMIAAPTFGEVVKEQNIWWTPEPTIRRVLGTTAGVPAGRGPS